MLGDPLAYLPNSVQAAPPHDALIRTHIHRLFPWVVWRERRKRVEKKKVIGSGRVDPNPHLGASISTAKAQYEPHDYMHETHETHLLLSSLSDDVTAIHAGKEEAMQTH